MAYEARLIPFDQGLRKTPIEAGSFIDRYPEAFEQDEQGQTRSITTRGGDWCLSSEGKKPDRVIYMTFHEKGRTWSRPMEERTYERPLPLLSMKAGKLFRIIGDFWVPHEEAAEKPRVPR